MLSVVGDVAGDYVGSIGGNVEGKIVRIFARRVVLQNCQDETGVYAGGGE